MVLDLYLKPIQEIHRMESYSMQFEYYQVAEEPNILFSVSSTYLCFGAWGSHNIIFSPFAHEFNIYSLTFLTVS